MREDKPSDADPKMHDGSSETSNRILPLTVFFRRYAESGSFEWTPMSIVAETMPILNRRNSPLISRAEISDGSGRRFFVGRRKKLRC
jgi:hypothetical protein